MYFLKIKCPKKTNKILLVNFFLALSIISSYSQNIREIDSLKTILNQTTAKKLRIDLMLEIALKYQNSNLDSLNYFLELSLPDIETLNYKTGKTNADFIKGIYFYRLGNYTRALDFYQQALQKAQDMDDFQILARVYNTLGIVLDDLGKYQEAIAYYKRSLIINHLSLRLSEVSDNWNNIGVAYKNLGNYSLAIDFFQKSLLIAEKINKKSRMARNYNNIAIIYELQKNYHKAFFFYNKALSINQEIGSLYGLANNYYNLGDLEGKQKHYEQALTNYLMAFKIDSELGDKAGIASDYSAIANILLQQKKLNQALSYLEKALIIQETNQEENKLPYTLIQLAEVHFELNNLNLALENVERAYQIALNTKKLEYKIQASELLSKVYAAQKNYQKAHEYQVIFKQTSDSSFNTQKTEEITRLESEYRFNQEKEKLKIEQETKVLVLKTEKKSISIQRTSFLIGLIITLLLIIIIIRVYYLNRQANQKLLLLNEEVLITNEELKITNDSLQNAITLVEHHRDEILSSIEYAQRIQAAILPPLEYFQTVIPHSFIYYQPKDVVSGDFYWLMESNQKIILAAVDCTGHGVPGAFMSMVGNDLLNTIVQEKNVIQADKILTQLHKDIRKSLQQKQTRDTNGMDIALVSIDLETQKLEFAGAQNPLIYIQNGQMNKVDGDIMSIGGVQQERERFFTLHEVDISQPTTFYLFSDGYQDQFGGKKGKKFMSKRFRELLLEIHEKPMGKQRNILEKTLSDWMGKEEQVDDILVIGVRV